jgi:DNA-binding PadR family transcriptional regulator
VPLRHAILGLLVASPSTGYELTQNFDRSLRNAWHASHSQVYPELARLADDGMIEVVAEGARGSRTWAVTDAGRDELRRWLTEAEPNRGVRNETFVRAFLLLLLDPQDRLPALERELAYREQTRGDLEALDAKLAALPEPSAFAPVVDLGLRVDEPIQAWLREQIEIARRG